MESLSTERKRMRAQSFPSNVEVGERSEPQGTPAGELEFSDQAEIVELSSLEGKSHALKKSRFAVGSPENPLLLGDSEGESNERSSDENRSELIQIMDGEDGIPAVGKFTVTQSDEDMENEAAAVTVQKSVSQRVAKKAAAAEAAQRRSSPRLQGRPETEKPVYFLPRKLNPKGKGSHGSEETGVLNDCEKTASSRVTQSDGAVQSDVALPNGGVNTTSADSSSSEAEAGAFSLPSVLALTASDMLNPENATSMVKSNRKPKKSASAQERSRIVGSSSKSAKNGNKEACDGNSLNVVDDVVKGHPQSSYAAPNVSDTARVKDTLRIFNAYFLQFVKEEEDRCKKVEGEKGSKVKKSKREEEDRCKKVEGEKGSKIKKSEKDKDGSNEIVKKRPARRPDLKAISQMIDHKAILYSKKQFGHLPGVNVGDHFFSRCEMVAIGLHSHWLNGIDFMGIQHKKMEEYKGYTFPITVAIVLSGEYEDDVDNSEDVIYTGQGGQNLLGDKRQIKDQLMLRGNLALKNSMDQETPVRVIRGHQSSNSYSGKVYTYDGLYKVIQYWAERGLSGFTVFKFRLRRLVGQPVLTTDQVRFSRAQLPKCPSELKGLASEDISNGQERLPVPASNLIDEPAVPPTGFTYLKNVKVAKGVEIPPPAEGCNCKGECVNPRTCSCARLNGMDFPYVRRDGGRLVEAKDVVYECGPNCSCGPACVNRTSQYGLKYRLEVFLTPNKGWAVRSWDSIPAGAPVCEYTGILMRTVDLDAVKENNFIFEIDCLQTMKGIDGRQRRLGDVSKYDNGDLEKLDDKKDGQPEFCIDAGTSGGVARFINHSCDPNLFVQCVLSSHHDPKLARVMLFAADNIPPLQELTYDYGYTLDSVVDEEGKVKKMQCYCGAVECRKRLF